jgi:hypothetical protein
MTWYFQHQLARDIIAEHEREAAKIRLARLVDEADRDALPSGSRRSPIRRAIGGTVLAFGEAVTRLGRALDGAESSPSA